MHTARVTALTRKRPLYYQPENACKSHLKLYKFSLDSEQNVARIFGISNSREFKKLMHTQGWIDPVSTQP